MTSRLDHNYWMNRALALARRGEGLTRPNPPVGAVIVCGSKLVGQGWHRRAGTKSARTGGATGALGRDPRVSAGPDAKPAADLAARRPAGAGGHGDVDGLGTKLTWCVVRITSSMGRP